MSDGGTGSARFVGSSSHYLEVATDVAALKFDNPDSSFSVWFRARARHVAPGSGSATHEMVNKYESGTMFSARMLGTVMRPGARIIQSSSGANHDAISPHRATPDGVINFGVAVSISPIYLKIFHDGVNKASVTTAWNGTIFDATSIPWGIGRDRFGLSDYFLGDISHVALWNVALSGAEFNALAQGCSPLKIGGSNLKAYWPCNEPGGNRRDWVAGNNMVQTGTVGAGPEIPLVRRPVIWLPGEDLSQAFTPVAPANTVAPVASGTPEVGQTLSCTTGSWTGYPAPTFTYQWQYNDGAWNDIAGATSSTWLVTVAGAVDVGDSIRCNVTGTNASGSATAASNSLGPVTDVAFANHFMGAAVS